MRSVVYRRAGPAGEVAEVIEEPAPAGARPGELIVRVHRSPVHPGDLIGPLNASPRWFTARPLGTEGMGTVQALGAGVTGFAVGDRVAFFPVSGAWREILAVPAGNAVIVPDGVSDDVAALMLVNTITSREILRAVADERADDERPFIVTAAASAVGRLVVAGALDRGIPVVAVVRSAQSVRTVGDLFPHTPVVATEDREWKDAVGFAVGEQGVPVIADAHGGPFVPEILPFLSDGGTLLVWGDLSAKPTGLMTSSLLGAEYRLRGVSISRWWTRPERTRADDVAAAVRLATQRRDLLPVGAVFSFDEVAEAIAGVHRPAKPGTVLFEATTSRDQESRDQEGVGNQWN